MTHGKVRTNRVLKKTETVRKFCADKNMTEVMTQDIIIYGDRVRLGWPKRVQNT